MIVVPLSRRAWFCYCYGVCRINRKGSRARREYRIGSSILSLCSFTINTAVRVCYTIVEMKVRLFYFSFFSFSHTLSLYTLTFNSGLHSFLSLRYRPQFFRFIHGPALFNFFFLFPMYLLVFCNVMLPQNRPPSNVLNFSIGVICRFKSSHFGRQSLIIIVTVISRKYPNENTPR